MLLALLVAQIYHLSCLLTSEGKLVISKLTQVFSFAYIYLYAYFTEGCISRLVGACQLDFTFKGMIWNVNLNQSSG